MRILRDLKCVEQSGFGINKITEIYGKEVFKITDNFITVILPFDADVMKTTTKTTTKTLSAIEERIVSIIEERPDVTAKKISIELAITEDGVRYHLKKLKKQNLIEYIGSSKNGYWKIKD